MAKTEFLHNLKTARNLFFHRVQTDGAGVDPQNVEAQVARAAIWLTPSSVKGFDVRDFRELPEESRRELVENVDRFLQVARKTASARPPTAAQVTVGMGAFLKVLNILAPYVKAEAELTQVRSALENLRLPKSVLTWNCELGADSTGDPAVWVWVFVDDQAAHETDFPEMAAEIERKVREALAAAGITRWPYVRFRAAAEQRALSAPST